MAIRACSQRRASAVTDFDPERMDTLLTDLWDTMEVRGGVGIAAPQIGEFVRVVVFGIESSERYPEAPPVPRTVLVNPLIEPLDDDRGGGLGGLPQRARHAWPGAPPPPHPLLGARSSTASSCHAEVDGFHARVVQHECDHLDGILYPMRVRDLRNFGFEDELAALRPHMSAPFL